MSRSILLATAASAAMIASAVSAAAQQTETVEDITVTAQALSAARAGIQTQIGRLDLHRHRKGHPESAGRRQCAAQFRDPADAGRGAGFLWPAPYPRRAQRAAIPHRRHHPARRHQRVRPDPGSPAGAIGAVDRRRAAGRIWPGYRRHHRHQDQDRACSIPAAHISMYGGSHNTLEPSFDYGGSTGSFNYFLSGDYNTNSLGIESPDRDHTPLHDRTEQWHGFAFLQDILDQNSSLTAILGTSNDMFEIPNTPGLEADRAWMAWWGWVRWIRRLRQLSVAGEREDPVPVRTSGRAPARDHPLRHPQLSALVRERWISGFRCSAAIPACSSRRVIARPRWATFSTTASPRPPTSATTPMARRTKAPGIWAPYGALRRDL